MHPKITCKERSDCHRSKPAIGPRERVSSAELANQPARSALRAARYLPGGFEYRQMIANGKINPRGHTPMKRWVQEWERQWESMSGK